MQLETLSAHLKKILDSLNLHCFSSNPHTLHDIFVSWCCCTGTTALVQFSILYGVLFHLLPQIPVPTQKSLVSPKLQHVFSSCFSSVTLTGFRATYPNVKEDGVPTLTSLFRTSLESKLLPDAGIIMPVDGRQ